MKIYDELVQEIVNAKEEGLTPVAIHIGEGVFKELSEDNHDCLDIQSVTDMKPDAIFLGVPVTMHEGFTGYKVVLLSSIINYKEGKLCA